jgi:hypothetical protein
LVESRRQKEREYDALSFCLSLHTVAWNQLKQFETAPFAHVISKEDEKSKKDWWDKADIVAKWLIGLASAFAAISVVYMGGRIQKTITNQTVKTQESIATQNTGKDYVQIALRILEQKDLREDMKKNIGLRKWAVGLLKYYSPVTLDDSTADKLINGDVEIPFTAPAPWQASERGASGPERRISNNCAVRSGFRLSYYGRST